MSLGFDPHTRPMRLSTVAKLRKASGVVVFTVMSKLPAFQFYPSDWRSDPGVQSLDYFDRGVWFEILCLMHESSERGKLLLNGKPMPTEALARVLGLDKQKLSSTLTTLLEFGIASTDDATGALICRRMVRDEEIRTIRAKAGKMGGNPVLLNQSSNQNASKTQAKRKQTVKQNPTPSSSSSSSSIREKESASAKREISDNTEQNQRTEINGKTAIPVNPVSKEETEQIESFLTEIRSAYNTNCLGNEPRWVDSVLDAIASGLTPKQYSDAARFLLTDKSRKYPITPANVLALAIEQRAKTSGVKAPAKNGGFLH